MKHLRAARVVAALVLVGACDSSSSSTGDDAGTNGDATIDADGGSDASTTGDGAAPDASSGAFFALDVNTNAAWPSVPFSLARLWDTGMAWSLIETSDGVYDFTALDAALALAEANGQQVLYTFGRTPTFASSDPTDSTCAEGGGGQCAPPSDIAIDGSGTDAYFKAFVAALISHVGSRIQYYEVWNEVNNVAFWKGSPAQLARMAFDLKAAVALGGVGASVLTPSTCNCKNDSLTDGGSTATNPQDGMQAYLSAVVPASVGSATGASLADGIAFHPYLGKPDPEGIVGLIQKMRATMLDSGVAGLPLWDTESSWGKNQIVTDCPDSGAPPFSEACKSNMASFVARSLVLAYGESVARFCWYQWSNRGEGTLWDSTDGPLPAAQAYATVEKWLTGATMSPCANNGSVWSCNLTRSGGYHGQIVWSADSATSYVPDASLVQSEDLTGAKTDPIGSSVSIGPAPILLETSDIP